MADIEQRIEELENHLKLLHNQQLQVNSELNTLQEELRELKKMISPSPVKPTILMAPVQESQPAIPPKPIQNTKSIDVKANRKESFLFNEKLEDFIGTNLISKIGILITIIGVFIGAKYAIDKDLISPAVRIALGYAAGATLIITALSLKKKYDYFSAILMGGGLAIFYFITYISYSFYQLFPQTLSFLLMMVITSAAVTVALWYNQKIIAILGQVAAYAIPFLLSDGSGKVLALFIYISLINVGLLILSFKKNWKILYRIAFGLTWLIYLTWYIMAEPTVRQFYTGIIFLAINFLTFYATFLSYKVVRKELYNLGEVAILLINALIFFFLGSSLIYDNYPGGHVLTYFAIANAIIHLGVGAMMYKFDLTDRSVYQFLLGLGFLFITIAIPVELNGSWVTLLWTIEATVLCWIAFKNDRSLYLVIAAPMIAVASISLLQDWSAFYYSISGAAISKANVGKLPFLHLTFLFSLFVSACFGYISRQFSVKKPTAGPVITMLFGKLMPALFLLVLYFTFGNEIDYSWSYSIKSSSFHSPYIQNLKFFQQLSWFAFSFFFIAVLLEINRRVIKSSNVTLIKAAAILFIAIFLLQGLFVIGELRDNYLSLKHTSVNPSIGMLAVRYICFIALACTFTAWKYSLDKSNHTEVRLFTTIFNISLLTIICNEFIHWMDLAGYQNQYKLGLSIICGLYALVLIFIGITLRQKHLRVGAIVLFALTLLKLFFYDLSSLSTISKTVVLVLLGIILLVVSFLYNKYKNIILGQDEEKVV